MAVHGDQVRRLRLVAAGLCLGMLAGCGPAASPPAADASKTGAATPPNPASTQPADVLPLAPPLKWSFAEGVTVSADPAASPAGSGHAVALVASPEIRLHRIGVEGNYGGGAKTYHVTVWVKGTPGTDAMLEARGKTFENGLPADYAVTYFDLAKVALQPNKLVTDKTKFPAAAIAAEGDWRKLTVDMNTRDGWIYLVIGATAKGLHTFPGGPDKRLVVGGVQIQPG